VSNEVTELRKFNKTTVLNSAGELIPNAGKYSRGAVVAAFEMIGGVQKFAEWAEDNKTEFYTKLLGKTIGRETETKPSDSVEEYLKILDGEAEDITDEVNKVRSLEKAEPIPDIVFELMAASKIYTDAEPID